LVLVHLNFTTTSLFRQMRRWFVCQSTLVIIWSTSRSDYKYYPMISELIGVVSGVLIFARQNSRHLGLACQDGRAHRQDLTSTLWTKFLHLHVPQWRPS
jgi:hypothetical protein